MISGFYKVQHQNYKFLFAANEKNMSRSKYTRKSLSLLSNYVLLFLAKVN